MSRYLSLASRHVSFFSVRFHCVAAPSPTMILTSLQWRSYAGRTSDKLPMDEVEVDQPNDPYQLIHQKAYLNRPESSPENDDRNIGAYPHVPFHSDQLRPPYPDVPYDDSQTRRYVNEDVHEEGDVLSMWMPDEDRSVSIGFMTRAFLGFFGVLGTLIGVLYYVDDQPYKRLQVVPRTLYIDDPIIKQYEDQMSSMIWFPPGWREKLKSDP